MEISLYCYCFSSPEKSHFPPTIPANSGRLASPQIHSLAAPFVPSGQMAGEVVWGMEREQGLLRMEAGKEEKRKEGRKGNEGELVTVTT